MVIVDAELELVSICGRKSVISLETLLKYDADLDSWKENKVREIQWVAVADVGCCRKVSIVTARSSGKSKTRSTLTER